MHQKKQLLSPLAQPRRYAALLSCYDGLICKVVGPHLACCMPCTTVHYSAFPTLRVQHPSDLATIRPHVDGMYGLQAGSLNFWLPLTSPVHASATLHIESTPGAEDYHPLLPPATAAAGSTLFRFLGRRCLHYTVPNQSARTRVSLDFRVIPGDFFDPENRLSRCRYYSTAARTDSGGFRKVEMGKVSKLHGLPHTGPPD
eukprot:2594581-Pleurochrysis_carterae.AAC.1